MTLAVTVLLAVCYSFLQVECSPEYDPCNKFDKYHNFKCPSGRPISRVWGHHDNGKEDRIYCYSCDQTAPTASSCYTTGYVNNYNYAVAYQCSPNYYIAGVTSVHDNGYEDRRFSFQCCKNTGNCTTQCSLAGPENKFDGNMDYRVPQGYVVIGAFSWHSNSKQ